MGIAIPAYVALSNGKAHAPLGNKEDFLRVRQQMQQRKRRVHSSCSMAKSGHGRHRICRAVEKIESKESNFAKSYNHFISKRVIDFALKNNAGTIHMEWLKGFGANERNKFILRNWSYFNLQTDIEYKAKRYGINVIKIDPYHTSQTCSACGNYEEGQREKQNEFICKKCGFVLNADHNAAINIARSSKIVTKKQDTEYDKRHKQDDNTVEA